VPVIAHRSFDQPCDPIAGKTRPASTASRALRP